MPTIIASDYQVLRDGNLRLDNGEKRRFSFNMQNAFHYSGALRNHGLLSFNIRPAESGTLTVRAIGSGPEIIMSNRTFSKSHTRMHQEAFDLDAIVAATNQSIGEPIGSLNIDFEVDDGPFHLSDIVIHYKIAVPVT